MKKEKAEKAARETLKAATKLTIPPIKKRTVLITIVGDSPLLVYRFSEKARRQILEGHTGGKTGAREKRDPQAEFEAAKYRLPNGKYGIPAAGIKNCAVSACRFLDGVKMTQARGAFFVVEDQDGLVPITFKGEPAVDCRMVAIGKFGNKIKTERFRPRFDDWSCSFKVLYDPDIISAEQLLDLYERAGFSVGLCEYRPERSGSLGMFHVKRG